MRRTRAWATWSPMKVLTAQAPYDAATNQPLAATPPTVATRLAWSAVRLMRR